MALPRFTVIIIGAGPAGVTAAGALAGAGISVALLEAGVYAGAENWSGCVYFTESLAAEDCFGPVAVASAPFERAVAKRGTLMHNGQDVVGLELRDREAFRDCYTVLRPLYDPYFANLAARKGAVHLPGTTVTSLIRNNNRVVGVDTNRGALYADVTFLAEGDASHLVRAEQLERLPQPHFLQGVKAVLSLGEDEIEKRFGLKAGEGAAYELLLRNPAIGGRTAHLNIGGFLYTNRDSLSLGYVAPLDNIRDNFRGSHDAIYEWMRGLPFIGDLIEGATLSAYGTKIIRSGGWHERPLLVQDGFAVGGASANLGIDIPFPNFTGPSSATGLFFTRAVKNILKRGGSFDERELAGEYIEPLRESACGRNAEHLSRWPAYFGSSRVLFGRTLDTVCGTMHFLSTNDHVETGRFLRSNILSLKGLREITVDTVRAVGALRLGKPLLATLFNPATFWRWTMNLVKTSANRDQKLRFILHIRGREIEPASLPWPVGSLFERMSPALSRALAQVYANNGKPLGKKLSRAVRHVLQGFRLTDIALLPAYATALFFIALGTAVVDAFRFYVLKTPVDILLAEPVMAYQESLRKARDLDLVKPSLSLEAKLATNTYRVGAGSHIRTLWPESVATQPAMSRSGLWHVCPARVYVYDVPPFSGRGKVTVNFENCIKCESCWRAEPGRALWGRHTDHKLIYRPESASLSVLLDTLKTGRSQERAPVKDGDPARQEPGPLDPARRQFVHAVLHASSAFRESVEKLPLSADKARTAWPLSLGLRLSEKLTYLDSALADSNEHDLARMVRYERAALGIRLGEGRLFHALYCSARIEERITARFSNPASQGGRKHPPRDKRDGRGFSYEHVSAVFPDRVVKQWEDSPMPEASCEILRTLISDHRDSPFEMVRVLSSVNPALGLIASHQLAATGILSRAGFTPDPGVCAVDGHHIEITQTQEGVRLKGFLSLVPAAAGRTLLLCAGNSGYLVPFTQSGVTITPAPAIGFRAAGLSDIGIDCLVEKQALAIQGHSPVPDARSCLAIALGAADYLSLRVKEHASGRVQFPGQMIDTEGRDGIAKLGAVKALIARIEAWRMLLQTLYDVSFHSEVPTRHSELGLLFSTIAAKAFGPEPGSMGYDAGQVFGGFAYSEDDLLSRFYRDSSLFRFLAPGYGAAAALNRTLAGQDLEQAIPFLGSLDTVQGEPLQPLAFRLHAIMKKCADLAGQPDASLAGEAKAMVTALRGMLVSIEEALSRGEGSETRAAAAEVLLGLAEDAVMQASLSGGRGSVPPSSVFPVAPPSTAIMEGTDYDAFCTAPGAPHRSGSFLATVFDRSPRFVPEMQMDDPKLRARWADLVNWFRQNCSEKQFNGLGFERSIDRSHHLPAEIIQAAKNGKWLATYIPQSLDGLGWRKAEYYLLNSAAGSFGDASIDLLIMASTSIGTTPILLGLEEELPRVREELTPLVEDEGRLGSIGARLARLIRALSRPNPAWIRKEYEAIMKLVDDRIRHTRVVKYLAAHFLKAFYGAGIAGQRGDFGAFMEDLRHAGGLFDKVMPDIRASLEELPRRERCHRLFLRYLGHSAVSAFALTEPTAGSDSGGVQTTAKLLKARMTPLDDGRYSFQPQGDEESFRYLIDADKIVFTDVGIAYETPDKQKQPIRYDQYDYRTDQGSRYYLYKGKECPFHDIGQVRSTDNGSLYEYYSLTGAKMWITNGSIATQFCLYARTPEGVTGFMVDRHSEGLKVGADEKKTGQRGSPTNEISIDSVRVPREAVIGYEGHGQVNALETLNVGRCGLAVVSGALMRKLLAEANAAIPASEERDRLLGEAAAILFGSESLASYLIGLFDRPHESVRMESAIAKYVCSEDIHELITLVEQAYGPAGQTEKHLLEKARRDSRILTIYEGTNEVQRFLILKDLIAMAANWPELSEQEGPDADRTLAAWKNRLRSYVREASRTLGDTGWSDAMLQPALFPLSEMAGEILRLECIRYRREWLNARRPAFDLHLPDYGMNMLSAGRRAAERTRTRLEHLEEKFLQNWEQVRNSMDMPEVRLADAALDEMSRKEPAPVTAPGALAVPLRALSIIRPVADLSPRPRLADGELRELVWRINPSDLAALTQLLALKPSGDSLVSIDVLMPGGVELESLLRMTAGPRADSLHRLDIAPSSGPAAYVPMIQNLEGTQQYDLIAVGDAGLDGDRSLGAYLAGRLDRHHERTNEIEVKPDGSGFVHPALPSVISIAGAASEPEHNIVESISALNSPISVMTSDQKLNAVGRFDLPSGARSTSAISADPLSAAEYIRVFAASASAGTSQDYRGELPHHILTDGNAIWAVLEPHDPKGNIAVLRACVLSAGLVSRNVCAVIPAPRDKWPQLLGVARANGCEQAYCLDSRNGRLTEEGKRQMLRLMLQASNSAMIFAGTEWASSLAYAAGEADDPGNNVLLCSGVTDVTREGPGALVFSLPAYEGRLIRRHVFVSGSAFVTVAPEADFPAQAQRREFKAHILDLAVDPGWIMPLPPTAPPTLAQADVIIDLGYGIRDNSGIALAQELKKKLEALGLAPMFGATRKVTQDLKLLPLDAQIGQTGVRVNPKLIIALGISGAPQHTDYLGSRAEILCFNKDREAPLMKLNQNRPAPRVHPIPGDLFVTVRELIERLG